MEVQEARSRCLSLEQNLLRLVHVLQENRADTQATESHADPTTCILSPTTGLPLNQGWRIQRGAHGKGDAKRGRSSTHASVILVQPFRFRTSMFLQFWANVLEERKRENPGFQAMQFQVFDSLCFNGSTDRVYRLAPK